MPNGCSVKTLFQTIHSEGAFPAAAIHYRIALHRLLRQQHHTGYPQEVAEDRTIVHTIILPDTHRFAFLNVIFLKVFFKKYVILIRPLCRVQKISRLASKLSRLASRLNTANTKFHG